MSNTTKLLSAAFIIALPVMSSAAMPNVSNNYISSAGVWNVLGDNKIKGATDTKVRFKDGWGALGTVGTRWNDNYRAEFELGYRENQIKSVVGSPVAARGHNGVWTFMANGLYDFTSSTVLTPYLGAGIGLADVKYSNVALSTTSIDDSSLRPAVQGIAGINYKMTDSLSLFTNYQYLITSKFNLKSGSVESSNNYKSNAILAGITYRFGAPTPKPVSYSPAYVQAAVVAPAPQKKQNIYSLTFGWDQAILTKQGIQVVNDAATKALNMNNVLIYVTGYTDTSGPSDYNITLSKKRAQTVQKALIKLGVPENNITISSKGETEPLIDTGNNVREVKNRRVVIVYPTQ